MQSESHREAIRELKELIHRFSEIAIESVVRTEELGTQFNFESARSSIELVKKVVFEMNDPLLYGFPESWIKELNIKLKKLLGAFAGMQTFVMAQQDPIGARNQAIISLENHAADLMKLGAPALAMRSIEESSRQRDADNDIQARADAMFAEIKNKGEQILAEARAKDVEVALALKQAREFASEAGVSQQAIYFSKEAIGHRQAAILWLCASVVFGGGIVWFALWNLQHLSLVPPADTPIWWLAQRLVAKIILLSVLSFFLVFAVRNYSTSRHNFIVNRHRQNALSTFKEFVAATETDKTKDAVLMQATKSIFVPQSSGYLRKDNEQGQAGLVIEVLRGLTGK